MTGPGAQTLPLKIYSSLKVGVTPKINALCTLMLGVVFLFVGVSQWIRAKRPDALPLNPIYEGGNLE